MNELGFKRVDGKYFPVFTDLQTAISHMTSLKATLDNTEFYVSDKRYENVAVAEQEYNNATNS